MMMRIGYPAFERIIWFASHGGGCDLVARGGPWGSASDGTQLPPRPQMRCSNRLVTVPQELDGNESVTIIVTAVEDKEVALLSTRALQ